jgi:hypothetical protein
MVAEVTQIVEHVKELLSRRDQGFRDITAYLTFQKEEMQKRSDDEKSVLYDIVQGLEKLSVSVSTIKNIKIPNGITHKELKEVFAHSLETIEKFFQSQNDIPERTEYEWTNGRMTKATEFFVDYELVYEFSYDREGNLISHTVTKR